MLRVTNTSTNVDAVVEINDAEVASLNGSMTSDNAYMSMNTYNLEAVKAAKTDVASDVAEYVEILLNK
jgi:hypothetical protein